MESLALSVETRLGELIKLSSQCKCHRTLECFVLSPTSAAPALPAAALCSALRSSPPGGSPVNLGTTDGVLHRAGGVPEGVKGPCQPARAASPSGALRALVRPDALPRREERPRSSLSPHVWRLRQPWCPGQRDALAKGWQGVKRQLRVTAGSRPGPCRAGESRQQPRRPRGGWWEQEGAPAPEHGADPSSAGGRAAAPEGFSKGVSRHSGKWGLPGTLPVCAPAPRCQQPWGAGKRLAEMHTREHPWCCCHGLRLQREARASSLCRGGQGLS